MYVKTILLQIFVVTVVVVIDSTIHPDTKEKIPLPFRMASFVPTNLVVVAGLLVPNPSV